MNAHLEKDLSRRDDLWSLLYVLVEFVEGDLPWKQACLNQEKDETLRRKQECAERPEQLTANRRLPQELVHFSNHLKDLSFESKPDYEFLRSLLSSEQVDTAPYDWECGDEACTNDLGFHQAQQPTPDASQYMPRYGSRESWNSSGGQGLSNWDHQHTPLVQRPYSPLYSQQSQSTYNQHSQPSQQIQQPSTFHKPSLQEHHHQPTLPPPPPYQSQQQQQGSLGGHRYRAVGMGGSGGAVGTATQVSISVPGANNMMLPPVQGAGVAKEPCTAVRGTGGPSWKRPRFSEPAIGVMTPPSLPTQPTAPASESDPGLGGMGKFRALADFNRLPQRIQSLAAEMLHLPPEQAMLVVMALMQKVAQSPDAEEHAKLQEWLLDLAALGVNAAQSLGARKGRDLT